MDANLVAQALKATTVAENQEKAGEYLKEARFPISLATDR
jgi:hypothetical protein